MPWSVECLRERGVAVVKLEGVMTEEDLRRMAGELFEEAGEFGLQKFLVDDRHNKPVLPTATIFKLPALFGSLGLRRGEPVALVHLKEAERHEDWRFFETVAYNEGFNVKLFSDMDQALQWLAHPGLLRTPAPGAPSKPEPS